MDDKTKNITYVATQKLIESSDSIPGVKQRASLVHSLICACGLAKKLNMVPSIEASEEEIRSFHSEDYVQHLQTFVSSAENEENIFGLGYDCPALLDTWSTVRHLAGASLRAADALVEGEASVAINWCGGWHHAQRDSAAGFCYVNDVVLAIRRLRSKFDRVLYVDLDVHHGDGVESAFLFSPKVMTLSLHRLEAGFFPGTGRAQDVGRGAGKFYAVNVPYKAGITDAQIQFLLQSVLQEVTSVFAADAVVAQCGADALAGDPLGGANVSARGYVRCVRRLLRIGKPTLLLGGGGYNMTNAAKLWTAITFAALGQEMPEEVPEHAFFPSYGPDFVLDVDAGLRRSDNTDEDLRAVVQAVKNNLEHLKR